LSPTQSFNALHRFHEISNGGHATEVGLRVIFL